MKLLILSSIAALTALSLPTSAQTAASGGAGGTVSTSPSSATVGTTTTTGNGAVIQQNGTGTRVINPVNPNPGQTVAPNANNSASAQSSSSNAFLPANATTNNNFAASNSFQAGTNFAGLDASNGVGNASNQFTAISNFMGTNAFFGTNFSGQDKGMTVFDTTLIFRIRRVVFDSNPQLTALNQLVNFLSQGGSVTVSGVVPTPEMQQTVISNVTAVPGVVAVNSRLVIDPRAAGVFARAGQPQASPNLAPTSDPALGDSRLYQSGSNRFNVRTGTPSTALPGAVSNRVSNFISTP